MRPAPRCLHGVLAGAYFAALAGLLPAAAARADDLAATHLRFHDDPAWIRRLDRVGREGLPMIEVHRGERSRIVFGVNRKGFIGFFTVAPPARWE
jgi:hypothetical protein